MSASAELQKLVFDLLRSAPAVSSLVGSRVFDSVPGSVTFPYISLGPTDIVEEGSDCIASGEHTLQIDVWSRAVGAVEAKRIVDAVKKALHEREATLQDNALVDLAVGFRSVVQDPDGKTSHGIVRLTALIEEHD